MTTQPSHKRVVSLSTAPEHEKNTMTKSTPKAFLDGALFRGAMEANMSATTRHTQAVMKNCMSSSTNESGPAVREAVKGSANQGHPTTRKMTRLERAVRLRDFAVAIVRARGAWGPFGSSRALGFEGEGLSIIYRTPFQQLPQAPEYHKYLAAVHALNSAENLPYGIDVWCDHKKKLNVEWSDTGQLIVVSYRRGGWEPELEKLAGEIIAEGRLTSSKLHCRSW
jgi:hypothetical protein